MQPYGIVYEENLFSLEQGMLFLHKKYGVMKKTALLKLAAVMFLFYLALSVISFFVAGDVFYPILVLILFIANIVMLPTAVKNTYVKPSARANFQRGAKQIVLFDDRMEYTTAFGKSVFFYEDIVTVLECGGIITVIPDTGTVPLCISSQCVKKGDYKTFLSLFSSKMGNRFEIKEGRK